MQTALSFLLVGCSGDGTVRVWHTPTLSPLYLIQPPHDNIGDLLSLVWVPSDLIDGDITGRQHKGKGRLYAGCQDTSIQVRDSVFVLGQSPLLTTSDYRHS